MHAGKISQTNRRDAKNSCWKQQGIKIDHSYKTSQTVFLDRNSVAKANEDGHKLQPYFKDIPVDRMSTYCTENLNGFSAKIRPEKTSNFSPLNISSFITIFAFENF
jgi:hypothetical protein